MTRPAALYISYDGMLEPLGQSQVIAYLEQLTDLVDYHLISFEKPADWADEDRRRAIADRLSRSGIHWHPLRYHKRPTLPATLFDITHGLGVALWLALRHNVKLVHARSYIPGLIAMVVKRLTGARFLLDIRGFWADERVDGGLWPADGRLYKSAKAVERAMLPTADHIVTLTEASVPILERMPGLEASGRPPISVITTCADLERFRPGDARPPAKFTLGYLGSLGTWYLLDELLLCFREIQQRLPDARLLIINRHDHDLVRRSLDRLRIDPAAVEFTALDHADTPAAIRRMTAGTAIIKPAFSKISSAPTKIAEYLGCGVPCLANTGVGDIAAILEEDRVGVALTDFSDADRKGAVDRLLTLVNDPDLAERCRATAVRRFSLANGAAAYHAIYARLLRSDARSARVGSHAAE